MVARALRHHPDPVLGAWDAYRGLRREVRRLAREIARRERKPVAGTGLTLSLRAMGYVGRFQPVAPLGPEDPLFGPGGLTDWREAAEDVLGSEVSIPGGVWVEIGSARPVAVNMAAMQAVSEALTLYPWLNRARLRGRLYQRASGEIMVHTSPRLDVVRSVVLNPSARPGDLGSTWNDWTRSLRGMARVEGHWLQPLATRLLRAWCREGFIASPAGAMISPVGDGGGIEFGWAPLIPANGIPLAITVCAPADGKAFIGVRPDHRTVDARHLDPLYRHLKREIPAWLARTSRLRRSRRPTPRS